MDCSMPDFPVLHYVPERAQTHIHWIDNAIQPSHPLPSPSPPAFHLHLQGRQSNQHRRRPARFTNCPQTPKQIRLLPTSLHGNLEFIINRQKPRKMTPEIQCDLRLQRDAPQKPTNISLKLFSESSLQTQLLPRLSLRTCSAAAITGLSGLAEASEGLSLWFVWLQENFFISCCSCWQIRSFSWGLYLMTLVCPLGKDKYTCAKLSRDSTFTPVTQTTVITSGWILASHSWMSLGPNPGSTTAQLCELRQMTSLP